MKLGSLDINELDFASRGNAVLGIRDSGKTYTATWLAERLLDAGIPFVAFDPVGVWRYLRMGANGQDGYRVVVAGDDADLPLTPESAPNIVRAAMRENIPLVLDLYSMHLTKSQWKQIVEQSVRLLLYKNKSHGTRHIFIEEAAEFVPQRVGADQGRVYAEIEKLARMGRNVSLGYTLINQRPEEVNKAVLELCDCLFLHRQKGRHSLTALDKWMVIADAQNPREVMKSLPTLPQGQCWVWDASSDRPVLVSVPQKRTLHPDPKASVPDTAKLSVDVSMFVARLRHALDTQQPDVVVKASKKPEPEPVAELNAEYLHLQERYQAQEADLQKARAENQQLRSRLNEVRKLLEPQYKTLQALFDEVSVPQAETDLSAWNIWLEKLGGKKRDMLKILIERKRITSKQLGLLVGMSAKGGSFNTYLSALTSLGLVERKDGDVLLKEIQP